MPRFIESVCSVIFLDVDLEISCSMLCSVQVLPKNNLFDFDERN